MAKRLDHLIYVPKEGEAPELIRDKLYLYSLLSGLPATVTSGPHQYTRYVVGVKLPEGPTHETHPLSPQFGKRNPAP